MTGTEPAPAGVPLLPLPQPDAQGIIELTSKGPYAARKIIQIGPLVIRCRQNVRPEIVIDDTPLFLLAEKVQLKGVMFRRANPAEAVGEAREPAAQLLVEALELDVRDTTFLTQSCTNSPQIEALEFQSRQSIPSAICWQVPDAAGPRNGLAALENVVVLGTSAALDLRSSAKSISLNNVLRLGAGPLVQITAPATARLELDVQLTRVTCRQSGSLVRWVVEDRKPAKQHVRLDAHHCVFDVLPTQGGLLEFVGEKHVADWSKRIKFVGDNCLAAELSEVAVRSSPTTDESVPWDSSELELEGITQEGFTFVGPFDLQPGNSAIQQASEGGDRSPGVDSTKFLARPERPLPVLAASPSVESRVPSIPRRVIPSIPAH